MYLKDLFVLAKEKGVLFQLEMHVKRLSFLTESTKHGHFCS